MSKRIALLCNKADESTGQTRSFPRSRAGQGRNKKSTFRKVLNINDLNGGRYRTRTCDFYRVNPSDGIQPVTFCFSKSLTMSKL